MAEFQQQSQLVKKLGARVAEAFEQHKDAPVQLGNQRLPEGIENGIALLRTMEFAEHKDGANKGKLYFRAVGVVEVPESVEVNGVSIRVAGQQTSTIIPMYDTPDRNRDKTFADHWAKYLNLFKQFNVSMPPGQQPGESKEACANRIELYFQTAAKMLCERVDPKTGVKGMPFKFRTWKGKKQTTGPYANREPNVNEEWQGACEYSPSYDPHADAVKVGGNGQQPLPILVATALAPMSNPMPAPFVEPPMGVVDPQSVPAQPQAAVNPALSQADLLLLGDAADTDPEGVTDEGSYAIAILTNEFRAAGITDEQVSQIEGNDGWTQVAKMVIAKRWPTPQVQSVGTGPASVIPPASPSTNGAVAVSKGGFLLYKGQRCEVTSVNLDAKTVTLKGPDGKTITGPDKRLLKVSLAECSATA